MKKFLALLFLSLFYFSYSFGAINKLYYDELFNGCMDEALKADLGYKITKNYCTCSADHFDNNYTDDTLIKLVEEEGGAAYNDVVDFVISKCRRKVGLS